MGWFKNAKKRILVVEDDADIALGLQLRLESADYETVLASNGLEAVEAARAEAPDLVLLDLMMPRLDGYEVCAILRTSPVTRSTPIVVVTALSRFGDTERAFQVGATDFLSKPFTNEQLLDKVKKALGPAVI